MRKFLPAWLALIFIILMGSGCAQLQDAFSASGSPAPVTLSLDQVEPSGQPGHYTLRGKTSLPDKTRLTVSAVRNFNVGDAAEDNQPSPFVILDRRFAEVAQGTWQTELDLWQVADNGRYQENWQLGQPVPPLGASPNPAVAFLVTLEPKTFTQVIDTQQLDALDKGRSALLGFTTAGEPYLQVAEARAVPLPTEQTAAGASAQSAAENPWADRSSLNAAAADFDKIPEVPFDENDNLPLPQSNLMQ